MTYFFESFARVGRMRSPFLVAQDLVTDFQAHEMMSEEVRPTAWPDADPAPLMPRSCQNAACPAAHAIGEGRLLVRAGAAPAAPVDSQLDAA